MTMYLEGRLTLLPSMDLQNYSMKLLPNASIPSEFGSHCIHIDTSKFSVTGEYEPDFDTEEIEITSGYPKDGRCDLKRIDLSLAANQQGIPLFIQTFSGNESDKESIRTIIQALTDNLCSTEKVYHIADAEF